MSDTARGTKQPAPLERVTRRWPPTLIEVVVALAIILILFSYDWITLPPAACAHLKAQWGPVRTVWDAYRLWFAGC